MAIAEKNLPDLNGLAGLLLSLVALSGEFPTALVERLPSTHDYRQKVVKALKRDNLLKTHYKDGLRGLRLTPSAKKRLVNRWPAWFSPHLTGNTETNRLKSDVPRRFRLHQMAEVLVAMYNAGVSVFPWEKPAVFQLSSVGLPETRITRSTYYNSREVKELGAPATRIRNCRSTGVLLSDGGVFIVYNTGPYQMKWEYKSEMRLKALLQRDICQGRLSGQFMDMPVNAIVFGSDMKRVEFLLGVGDGSTHNYFVLDGSMDHFYFLTNDHRGEIVLRLLCDGESRAVLDTILMQDLQPPNDDLPIENDAMDGSTPVLFGYSCDMPRLRKFDTALSILDQSGLVICFDYQEEAFRRCLGPRVRLQCLDFEACERTVFPSTENKRS